MAAFALGLALGLALDLAWGGFFIARSQFLGAIGFAGFAFGFANHLFKALGLSFLGTTTSSDSNLITLSTF